jgi:hypothetical protein
VRRPGLGAVLGLAAFVWLMWATNGHPLVILVPLAHWALRE